MWERREHDWRYLPVGVQESGGRETGRRGGGNHAARCRAGAVPGLRRADRCVVPQAITWKGFEQAEHPCRHAPHRAAQGAPNRAVRLHLVPHAGQGWAIDTAEAHGEVAHWEEPLLSASLEQACSLATSKSALIQMNCNTCHRFDRETQGAEAINLSRSASCRRRAAARATWSTAVAEPSGPT